MASTPETCCGGLGEQVEEEYQEWMKWINDNVRIDPNKRYPLVLFPIFICFLTLTYLLDHYQSLNLCAPWTGTGICIQVLHSSPFGGLAKDNLNADFVGYYPSLMTYSLHHFSLLHLFSNLSVGSPALIYLERRFGWLRTSLMVGLSTLFGALFVWAFFPGNTVGAGASVYVYALLFAIGWDRWVNIEQRRRLALTVAITAGLLLQIIVELIVHTQKWVFFAHLFGGLSGLSLSFAVYPNFSWKIYEYILLIITPLYLLFAAIYLPLHIVYLQ